MVRRTTNGSCEQMADAFLKNLIHCNAYRENLALTHHELLHLRRSEGGIGTEISPHHPVSVSLNDWLQHLAPVIGAVNVAGTQGTPFQIAELVEQEKGMIAGASEVTVVGLSFLVAMGRADAAVQVENDLLRRATVMNEVDPLAGKIAKRGEVFLGG